MLHEPPGRALIRWLAHSTSLTAGRRCSTPCWTPPASSAADEAILEDQERNPLTYTDLIRASFALGRKIAAVTTPGETRRRPAAVQRRRRGDLLRPARLRPHAGHAQLHRRPAQPARGGKAGRRQAGADLPPLHRAGQAARPDRRARGALRRSPIWRTSAPRSASPTGFRALAGALATAVRAPSQARRIPAVILFTSGSFGAPRGVVLTQANLLANVAQVAAHIDLDPDWVLFNPLPIFHCFGLTAGVLLPILTGMKAFQYPLPAAHQDHPGADQGQQGQRSCWPPTPSSTSTPASAEPDELSGLQFIVCGAEKVRDETHNLIAERFGPVPVLEGYGATEASPVIAVNKPGRQPPRHGGRPAARASRRGSSRCRASRAADACSCAAPTSWPAISTRRERSSRRRTAGTTPATWSRSATTAGSPSWAG